MNSSFKGACRSFVSRESGRTSHPVFPCEDNLAPGSANLSINRVSVGSSVADLTCGCLHSRRLAPVPALLCSQEDGIFLPRFQTSQDVGGSVSGKLHLHRLAWGKAVVEAVMVKLGQRWLPEKGQGGLCRLRNPKVLGCVHIWEEDTEMNPLQAVKLVAFGTESQLALGCSPKSLCRLPGRLQETHLTGSQLSAL